MSTTLVRVQKGKKGKMPESGLEGMASSSPGDTGAKGGTGQLDHADSDPEALETVLEDRDRMKQIAVEMKASGTLRIKDHIAGLTKVKSSFKGCYAVDWVQANVGEAVKTREDAVTVCQELLHLGYIVHYQHKPVFQDSSELYLWQGSSGTRRSKVPSNKNIIENVTQLRGRMTQMEEKFVQALDRNRAASLAAGDRTIEMDWRQSVTERRLRHAETALRRSVALQQAHLYLCLAAGCVYAYCQPLDPLGGWLWCAATAAAVVLLMESHCLAGDFLRPRIDYARIGEHITMSMTKGTVDDRALLQSPSLGADQSTDPFTAVGQQASIAISNLASVLKRMSVAPAPAVPAPLPPKELSSSFDVPPPARHEERRNSMPHLGAAHDWAAGGVDLRPRDSRGSSGGAAPNGEQPPTPVLRGGDDDDLRSRFARQRSQGLLRRSTGNLDHNDRVADGQRPLYGEPSLNSMLDNSTELPRVLSPRQGNLPDEADFTHGTPLLIKQPVGPIHLASGGDPFGAVRPNCREPVAFDGPLFQGRLALWVQGAPMAPEDAHVFQGKSRQSWLVCQGVFKERICVDRVMSGQAFSRDVRFMPRNAFIGNVLGLVVRSLTSTVASNVRTEHDNFPAFLYPLILGAQHVHVARPGGEPDISHICESLLEDVRLMAPSVQSADGGPAFAKQRQRYFSSKSNRENHFFEPGLIYTFHLWQHTLSWTEYRFTGLPGGRLLDLVSILDGQPLRFMAFDERSRHHIWNLEAWHRDMLPAARTHVDPARYAPPMSLIPEEGSVHGMPSGSHSQIQLSPSRDVNSHAGTALRGADWDVEGSHHSRLSMTSTGGRHTNSLRYHAEGVRTSRELGTSITSNALGLMSSHSTEFTPTPGTTPTRATNTLGSLPGWVWPTERDSQHSASSHSAPSVSEAGVSQELAESMSMQHSYLQDRGDDGASELAAVDSGPSTPRVQTELPDGIAIPTVWRRGSAHSMTLRDIPRHDGESVSSPRSPGTYSSNVPLSSSAPIHARKGRRGLKKALGKIFHSNSNHR